MILYTFACLVLELISRNHPMRESDSEYNDLVLRFFPDLQTTLLTLLQFVTADSLHEIYAPFVAKNPSLVILFIGIIFMVSVALMNLVTALIVESSLQQAASERDVQKAYKAAMAKKLIPRVRNLF